MNVGAVDTAPRPGAVNLSEKAALLGVPCTYGPAVQSVERIETHMSLLFVAGERVYKMKKPVRYPFLDFSTLAARAHSCRDELRLNRRLAPDVYLGLSTINRDEGGALSLDGRGEPIEWLVRMRRLPRERMLDRMIGNCTVTPAHVESLAEVLTRFYADLATAALDADDYVGQLQREHAVNRAVLAAFDPALTDRLLADVQRFLDDDDALLRARVAAGRIVEGHGDLRPEHVCLNTPPVVIDCLEFNERLRQVDPFDEITFLGLECARLGASWIGPMLLVRLTAALDDALDPRLLRFYARYRACVRARLALAHLDDAAPREPARWQPLARAYLRLGAGLSQAAGVPVS